MKHRRDQKDDELLPFKHVHTEDDKGKEDISDSSESVLVDRSLLE